MKNEEKDTLPKNLSVPLLISNYHDNHTESFAIINNRLLFGNRPWDIWINLQGAFNSLLWLFANFEEVFPIQCKLFFQGKEQQITIQRIQKNIQNKRPNVYCLLDLWAGWSDNQHFQYSLDINKNEQSIQLKEWTQFLNDPDYGPLEPIIEEVIHLEHHLEMTPQQAFLLFANNCVAYFDTRFRDVSNFEEIDDISSKLDIHELDIFLFVREYLNWLKKELTIKEIQLSEILRYNGYRTILRLSEKHALQKIVWEYFDRILLIRKNQKND